MPSRAAGEGAAARAARSLRTTVTRSGNAAGGGGSGAYLDIRTESGTGFGSDQQYLIVRGDLDNRGGDGASDAMFGGSDGGLGGGILGAFG